SVLVAGSPDDPPWRLIVDLVQKGQVTLATPDDEELPAEWQHIADVHLTSLDRFSVSDFAIPVLRAGQTRLGRVEPDSSTPVMRRAYARVFHHVPASGMLLVDDENHWIPFDPDVRDLGGGGCSLFADVPTPDGAKLVISFAFDEHDPIVVVGRVLPH